MNTLSRFIILLMIASTPALAGLKVKEIRDDFTGESYFRSGKVKLCQPKSRGGMAKCASLMFIWKPTKPTVVLMQVTVLDIRSLSQLETRIDGEIDQIESDQLFTDMSVDSFAISSSTSAESKNVFRIPVSSLRAIASSPENGKVRISGIDSATTYDFHRRTSMGKTTPAMRVAEFLAVIETK